MLSVTVVESPVAAPAAPDSATVVVFEYEPSAGVVSVTAGATQSAAVENVADLDFVGATNAARDACTPWPAAASAASEPRAARARLMRVAPPRRPRPPHATQRRGPTA